MKPPSTARRSTSRSGTSSARNSPSPPTRSISPSPPSFGLKYKTRDNTEATPLCIHRAPLGTHERFIGFLIEHYAGNFPLWLAPEQVRILPIGDEDPLVDYAKAIQQRTPRRRRPRHARRQHRPDQSQDRPRRGKESPHHARHRPPRPRSQQRQRPHPRQRQPRRQAARRSRGRHPRGDQRAARRDAHGPRKNLPYFLQRHPPA